MSFYGQDKVTSRFFIYYLYLTLIKKKSNCVLNFLILFHRVNSSYASMLSSYHVYVFSRLVVPASENLSSIFRNPGGNNLLVTFGSCTRVSISLVWLNEGLDCPVYYAYQAFCVYFSFDFNLLLSRTYFCVPFHWIFIGNSFRLCIKLCLFTYFS